MSSVTPQDPQTSVNHVQFTTDLNNPELDKKNNIVTVHYTMNSRNYEITCSFGDYTKLRESGKFQESVEKLAQLSAVVKLGTKAEEVTYRSDGQLIVEKKEMGSKNTKTRTYASEGVKIRNSLKNMLKHGDLTNGNILQRINTWNLCYPENKVDPDEVLNAINELPSQDQSSQAQFENILNDFFKIPGDVGSLPASVEEAQAPLPPGPLPPSGPALASAPPGPLAAPSIAGPLDGHALPLTPENDMITDKQYSKPGTDKNAAYLAEWASVQAEGTIRIGFTNLSSSPADIERTHQSVRAALGVIEKHRQTAGNNPAKLAAINDFEKAFAKSFNLFLSNRCAAPFSHPNVETQKQQANANIDYIEAHLINITNHPQYQPANKLMKDQLDKLLKNVYRDDASIPDGKSLNALMDEYNSIQSKSDTDSKAGKKTDPRIMGRLEGLELLIISEATKKIVNQFRVPERTVEEINNQIIKCKSDLEKPMLTKSEKIRLTAELKGLQEVLKYKQTPDDPKALDLFLEETERLAIRTPPLPTASAPKKALSIDHYEKLIRDGHKDDSKEEIKKHIKTLRNTMKNNPGDPIAQKGFLNGLLYLHGYKSVQEDAQKMPPNILQRNISNREQQIAKLKEDGKETREIEGALKAYKQLLHPKDQTTEEIVEKYRRKHPETPPYDQDSHGEYWQGR